MKALLILLLMLVPASAGARELERRDLDRIVNKARVAWKVPGVSVAIVENGKITHVAGYGLREAGTSLPVDGDTLFGIGSTTKAFTTTAIAMLVADGRMSWDDPVRKHLPYFRLNDPCADSAVTFRDIVSHRTGLSRHDWLWDNSPWNREEVIRRIGEVGLSAPFRTAYQYQNIMFIAAGEAVAAVSDKPWESFIRERILDPLSMTRTRLTTKAAREVPNHAIGHRFEPLKDERVSTFDFFEDENVAPAGSIHSSAKEMANWLLFNLSDGSFEGRNLLSPQGLKELRVPHTPLRLEGTSAEANPETNLQAYGLGWFVQDYRGELLVAHSGALNGYRAQVAMLPRRRSGVVILSNLGRSLAVTSIRNALLDALLGGARRDWTTLLQDLESKGLAKAREAESEAAKKRVPNTRPSRELSAYTGTYRAPGYREAIVAVDGDHLALRWSRLDLDLQHWHYDTFASSSELDEVDEKIVFRLDENGEVEGFEMFDMEWKRVRESDQRAR
jgi:CubicO group peptidase (beta-lactamase class C family)